MGVGEQLEHEVMIDLSGKTAMVTGASRNLGRVIATQLALAGATVACGWSHDEPAAATVCETITAGGGSAWPLYLDLEDMKSIEAAARGLAERSGTLDILVHNAAIRPHVAADAITPQEWDQVQAINVRGPFFLTRAALPLLQSSQAGRILFIGGLDAYWSGAHLTHVTVSKLAVVGLARALAAELASWGTTVNTVVPGPLQSVEGRMPPGVADTWLDRIPLGRFGHKEEVAEACLFLASEAAGYITGQELFVTGGASPLVRRPDDRKHDPAHT